MGVGVSVCLCVHACVHVRNVHIISSILGHCSRLFASLEALMELLRVQALERRPVMKAKLEVTASERLGWIPHRVAISLPHLGMDLHDANLSVFFYYTKTKTKHCSYSL